MERSSPRRLVRGHRPGALHPPRQRLAVDAGHDEEDQPVDFVGEVDRHDVRVVELGGRARLAQEALTDVIPGGDIRPQQLDRDRAIEAYLPGPEDEPHPPAAELGFQRIPAGQRLLQRQKAVIWEPMHA